jgi:hypothetical protein
MNTAQELIAAQAGSPKMQTIRAAQIHLDIAEGVAVLFLGNGLRTA